MVAYAIPTRSHRVQQYLHFAGSQEVLRAFVPIGRAAALTFDL